LQRGERPFTGQRGAVFLKSEPECRCAAFTKANYLIIILLKIENNGKITDILVTA
jgi:hypothetical protein